MYIAVSISYYDVLSNVEENQKEDDGKEMNLIGASVGSGIQDAWELNVMNYTRDMNPDDKREWEAIIKEHDQMAYTWSMGTSK